MSKILNKLFRLGHPHVDSYQQYIDKRKQIRDTLENFDGNNVSIESFRNILHQNSIKSVSIYEFTSNVYSDNYTIDENILDIAVKFISTHNLAYSDTFTHGDKLELYEQVSKKKASLVDLNMKEYQVNRRRLIWMKNVKKVKVKDNKMLIEYIMNSNYGDFLQVFVLHFEEGLN